MNQPAVKPHSIADVKFTSGNTGTVWCQCGEEMPLGDYPAHRTKHGGKEPGSVLGPRVGTPASWMRKQRPPQPV